MASILIAANDEALHHLLGAELRRFDHDVSMSASGNHIPNLIRKDNFDLAILDDSLRGTTALEILRQMNGHSGLGVKYMVLSSKNSIEIITEHMESGAGDFVVKPFNLSKLMRRIERILKPKPAREVMPPKAHKVS